MCRYKTLHLDEQLGYVLQCQECDSLTIGFNLLTFQVSPTEFLQIIRDIESCIHYYQDELYSY